MKIKHCISTFLYSLFFISSAYANEINIQQRCFDDEKVYIDSYSYGITRSNDSSSAFNIVLDVKKGEGAAIRTITSHYFMSNDDTDKLREVVQLAFVTGMPVKLGDNLYGNACGGFDSIKIFK